MSKWVAEQMLRDFGAAHGLRSICLRYFNAAGADPAGDIGEAHEPETHLIPLVLDAAADPQASVRVHGTSHPTPDGTCIRDYIHVCDIAQAHVLALQALQAGAPNRAYNLANGQGFSVLEVIDAARHATGRPVRAEFGPARPGDPPRLVGDASRIHRELGWRPGHAALPEIIGTAWRWHSSAARAAKEGPVG
jgi:UDP-glucose 4-epimerase